jgi:hypothetical protein
VCQEYLGEDVRSLLLATIWFWKRKMDFGRLVMILCRGAAYLNHIMQ